MGLWSKRSEAAKDTSEATKLGMLANAARGDDPAIAPEAGAAGAARAARDNLPALDAAAAGASSKQPSQASQSSTSGPALRIAVAASQPSETKTTETKMINGGTAPVGADLAGKTTMVGRTKITWDDSNMRSAYANVANVATTREEVMLLFGTSQAWTNQAEEVTVALTDRIVLNPFAAKRLLTLLAHTMQEYEKAYGPLK